MVLPYRRAVGRNEMVHIKHIAWNLAHSMCSKKCDLVFSLLLLSYPQSSDLIDLRSSLGIGSLKSYSGNSKLQ